MATSINFSINNMNETFILDSWPLRASHAITATNKYKLKFNATIFLYDYDYKLNIYFRALNETEKKERFYGGATDRQEFTRPFNSI